MYYPQYCHLCHAAFEDYFDSTAYISCPELISKKRLGFTTVAIYSNFTARLIYGVTAIINIAIKKIGGSSLVFTYSIRWKRDG